MESPARALSRSSSFAPGPHRRSHPNLQHLSLAPLTPKYPIDPADYDAYFDPATSELHTSASISQISALPSPGGILTSSSPAAQSRASSRSRLKRKARSNVSIHAPAGGHGHGQLESPHQPIHHHHSQHLAAPSGALSSEGFGHKKPSGGGGSSLRLHTSDSSWLIQTGLALTEGSRETKGQSWIIKRDSSTSLASPSFHAGEERPLPSFHATRSNRATPSVSRRNSFKRGSRRSLAMTPALHTAVADALTEQDADPVPDWADSRTQAEIAAQVENEIAEEFDYDGDPYGVLDFEGQFDSDDDEEDVRKEILSSGYPLGGWVDGIVDAFLRLEDSPGSHSQQNLDLEAAKRTFPSEDSNAGSLASFSAPKTGSTTAESAHNTSEDSVETPPAQRIGGIWEDVAWFGRLLARTVRS